ncbi:MAG: hypothetical protein KF689_10555 [Gemmatimonadaceae bacterium]|nr:hypothetical protein [Gemmatimonadaceae bacterium]MCW5825961.1 hypothetical protein [Gemmatimonadaceae bacterium]
MKRAAGRLAAPLAVAAAGLLACADAVTDPGAVAALDFTGIAFPALITGDTLRDGAGVATPLTATVYNGRGEVVGGAEIQYFSLDTGVSIDANGFLTATRRAGSVRLVAAVSGLQSQIRRVEVTRQPDTVVAPNTDIAFAYSIPDRAQNVSPALSLTLRSNDVIGDESPNVPGWRVRWRLVHNGDTLAPTDTSKFALWAATTTRHSLTDTTKADGVSSRRLRIFANLLPVQPDSVIVIAEVRALGLHVPGSPVRYTVTFTPPGF